MNNKIINIIIAGTGGQGVNSLYRVFLSLCAKNNFYTKSALYKGGSQRHGSVHTTLRLFVGNNQDFQWFSSQIKENGLDLLIGLEPWETIRYNRYIGKETKIWSNTHVVPLFSERFRNMDTCNPLEILKSFGGQVKFENYSSKAMEIYKDFRMANYLIGKDIIQSGILPFKINEYINTFIEQLNLSKKIEKQILEEII